MGICELIKKISPSFSTAYDSAIFIFPSLTDFISEPFSTIPASKISLKKKLKEAIRNRNRENYTYDDSVVNNDS